MPDVPEFTNPHVGRLYVSLRRHAGVKLLESVRQGDKRCLMRAVKA